MTAEALSGRVLDERSTKSERLELRVSPQEKELLAEAASATDRTISQFVVQSASIAAADVLADRTMFTLSPAAWDAFSAAIDREPRELARLARLLSEPGVLDPE